MKAKFILALGVATVGLLGFTHDADAARGFSQAVLNLRAGPDGRYPVVDRIPAHANIQVEGCTSGWGWCDVAWRGRRGWVPSRYLQVYNRNRPVYILEGGRAASIPLIQFNFGNYWDSYYRGMPFYRERDRYGHINDRNWHGPVHPDHGNWDRDHGNWDHGNWDRDHNGNDQDGRYQGHWNN